ncbi:MAG: methyltransferase domain-containing protein [Acholeplasmatales bacterium]|jgi:chemotaxis protein methyltransferase CheR|nr:methyltransferase domain-containing protein [Acholeplasmatales bacterium]
MLSNNNSMLILTKEEYFELQDFINENYGFQIPSIIKVEMEISRLLTIHKFHDFATYFRESINNPNGIYLSDLISALSNHYTFFNREIYQFNFLLEKGFSEIISHKEMNKNLKLNFLSVGCSSGEEPYTLSIFFEEYLKSRITRIDYQVDGIDLSLKMVQKARSGEYQIDYLRGIDADKLSKYFTYKESTSTYTILERIKNSCTFTDISLQKFKPTVKYDCVFCRNVLIYYQKKVVVKLIDILIDFLEKDGYLFLGGAEIVDYKSSKVKYVGQSTYQKL